jgi:hypothetical protein
MARLQKRTLRNSKEVVALGFGASERNWMLPYFMANETSEDSSGSANSAGETFIWKDDELASRKGMPGLQSTVLATDHDSQRKSV